MNITSITSIIIFIFYILFRINALVQKCPLFKINIPRINNKCLFKDEEYNQYNVTPCEDNNNNNFLCYDINNNNYFECVENKVIKNKYFIGFNGSKCSSNLDCNEKYLKCIENKCIISNNFIKTENNNENCKYDNECIIGYSCRIEAIFNNNKINIISNKKMCRKQITDNIYGCFKDTDCVNTHGCINNKCIEYFSLNNNDVINIDNIYEYNNIFNYYPFCNTLNYLVHRIDDNSNNNNNSYYLCVYLYLDNLKENKYKECALNTENNSMSCNIYYIRNTNIENAKIIKQNSIYNVLSYIGINNINNYLKLNIIYLNKNEKEYIYNIQYKKHEEYNLDKDIFSLNLLNDKFGCECGYNIDKKSYCKLYAGDNKNIKNEYILNIKKMLQDNNCHTLERFYCRHVVEENIELYNKINYYKYLLFYKHKFFNTDYKRYLKVFNKDIYNTFKIKYIINKKCPVYGLVSNFNSNILYNADIKDNTCVKVNKLENKDTIVYLKECKDNQYCNIKENYNFNSIVNKNTIYCEDKNLSKYYKKLRYPGENCKVDNDCYSVNIYDPDKNSFKSHNSCLNFKCFGLGYNNVCLSTRDCIVGFYCTNKNSSNKETKKVCLKLKKVNDKCLITQECSNELVCFKNKCIKYRSLDIGEDVSNIESNKYYVSQICKFGISYKGKCAGKLYNTNNTKNYNQLIECNIYDMCNYFIKYNQDNAIEVYDSEECQCGFNTHSKGYCPLSHLNNKNEELWEAYNESFIINRTKSNCHTLNRNCFIYYDEYINTITINHMKYKEADIDSKKAMSNMDYNIFFK